MTLNPKDFKTIPDWLLGGYWPDQEFKDIYDKPLDTKKYGDNKFHGRTHPAIAYMAIMRFTEPGDLVFIPFGGSGTEVDVCKAYNRIPFAIDLRPQREDIHKGDATKYTAWTNDKPKLIISHPPYEDIIVYGDESANLSKRGLAYETLVNQCSIAFAEYIAPKGILTLVIGSVYRDRQEIPCDYIWFEKLQKQGFKLIGRIIRSFGETKALGNKKNLWKYRLIKFNRFLLGNDMVLIFQK